MNKRNLVVLGSVIMALVLLLTPILGCGKPSPPAEVVKPDKVVIYHFGDLSGPYAPITAPIVTGLKDFAEWFNAAGGIDGVPITYEYRDTGGKLDAALAAYDAFKESKPYPMVELLYGSAESEALRERFVEDNIVCFTNSPSPTCLYPAGYEFSTIPSYCDSMGAFIDWVSTDWADKTGQDVKLAILTWDSTYGRAIMTDEVRDYAAKKGVEIVYEGVFGLTDMDVSTQLAAIKAAGANWVYDNTLAHGPGLVISKSAKALGMLNQELYDTTPGMIHRATGPWGMDESSVLLAPAETEGMVGPRSFASWSMPEVEGIAAAIATADAHNRGTNERVMGYLAAWSEVYTVCHCIEKAVDEVGWDNLDGSAVRDQFVKMGNFSAQGITRYTFSADKPEPRQTRIFQVQGGKVLPITDWAQCPDLRPYAYR